MYTGYNPVVLEDSIAINPITWTLEETLASKEESFGADIFSNFGKPSKIADAQVDKARGVVKCGSINPDDFYLETGGVFEKGVYHIYDIALYYYDLKENARKRLNAFWK